MRPRLTYLKAHLALVITATLIGMHVATAEQRVLLELFTSHGCYSCPPADRVLHELDNGDPNIIALEYHVDYWDQLVWGNEGSWQDPFSHAAFTLRQQRYHQTGLKGRNGVYTPQLVIQGQTGEIGSQKNRVEQWVRKASTSPLRFHWEETSDSFTVDIEGNTGLESELWLARFIRNATTKITSGENSGKALTNHNIVTQLSRLSSKPPFQARFAKPAKSGESCALIVQEKNQGPVLSASYCPTLHQPE